MNTKRKYYDLGIISYYTGYVVLGTTGLMVIPILTAILFGEWKPLFQFIIGCFFSIDIGFLLILLGKKSINQKRFQWKHGLAISALSWVLLMFLCAIPYYLSGNFKSYLDACFDIMSGFTTTGVILIQDLDHASKALNMWRHIITFVGGQGMVVLALSFLVRNTVGAYKMYVGEGKDIEILPNIKETAKVIWQISMIYLTIGTLTLWINGMIIGLSPVSAFFHGLYIYMSGWSTGGFAPMSQNVMYYHSLSYEITSIIFFIIGSFNFGLHYCIWKGDKKEIYRNIEIQSFFITATITTSLVVVFLNKTNVYKDAIAVFRRVVYNVLSAHTTTGFANLYARQFALQWGDFAIMVMVIAMLLGGSACSTAGGFKGLRIGIFFKGIISEIRTALSSEMKVKVYKFHYLKEHNLDNNIMKNSFLIILCYIMLFTIETLIGTYCGYTMPEAAFEAASVTGNVGLSIGVTSVSMPSILKVSYIIGMYLGRLEFISVFALIGFVFGGIKRICAIKKA